MCFDPLDPPDPEKSGILKLQDGGGGHHEKSPYLCKGLTVWQGYA